MECAIGRRGECLLRNELKLLADALNEMHDGDVIDTNGNILDQLMYETRCDTNLCVVENLLSKVRGTEYEALIQHIRDVAFLSKGPSDPLEWLDNFIINRVCLQIACNYPKAIKYGGLVMYDFCVNPITAWFADPSSIVNSWKESNWSQFHIMLNTDHRAGMGIHWVCLAISIDAQAIYYFDPVGRLPLSGVIQGTPNTSIYPDGRFISYVQEWINAISNEFGKEGIVLRFRWCSTKHQTGDDRSNCGVYCLHQLIHLARGKSFDEINANPISTETITAFREKIYVPTDNYSPLINE